MTYSVAAKQFKMSDTEASGIATWLNGLSISSIHQIVATPLSDVLMLIVIVYTAS